MGRVAAGHDFDRGAAKIAELREQLAHLRGVEGVTSRVRNYRRTPAAGDPSHRVTQARPLMRHKARLAAAEETPERALHVFHDTTLD